MERTGSTPAADPPQNWTDNAPIADAVRADTGNPTIQLRLLRGRAKQSLFTMRSQALLIGSLPHCDIQIRSQQVADKHCLLTADHQKLYLTALENAYPVYLNGVAVTKTQLFHEDQLQFGPFELQIVAEHLQRSAAISTQPIATNEAHPVISATESAIDSTSAPASVTVPSEQIAPETSLASAITLDSSQTNKATAPQPETPARPSGRHWWAITNQEPQPELPAETLQPAKPQPAAETQVRDAKVLSIAPSLDLEFPKLEQPSLDSLGDTISEETAPATNLTNEVMPNEFLVMSNTDKLGAAMAEAKPIPSLPINTVDFWHAVEQENFPVLQQTRTARRRQQEQIAETLRHWRQLAQFSTKAAALVPYANTIEFSFQVAADKPDELNQGNSAGDVPLDRLAHSTDHGSSSIFNNWQDLLKQQRQDLERWRATFQTQLQNLQTRLSEESDSINESPLSQNNLQPLESLDQERTPLLRLARLQVWESEVRQQHVACLTLLAKLEERCQILAAQQEKLDAEHEQMKIAQAKQLAVARQHTERLRREREQWIQNRRQFQERQADHRRQQDYLRQTLLQLQDQINQLQAQAQLLNQTPVTSANSTFKTVTPQHLIQQRRELESRLTHLQQLWQAHQDHRQLLLDQGQQLADREQQLKKQEMDLNDREAEFGQRWFKHWANYQQQQTQLHLQQRQLEQQTQNFQTQWQRLTFLSQRLRRPQLNLVSDWLAGEAD